MSDEIVRLLTEIRDLLAEQTAETARDTPQEEPPRRLIPKGGRRAAA